MDGIYYWASRTRLPVGTRIHVFKGIEDRMDIERIFEEVRAESFPKKPPRIGSHFVCETEAGFCKPSTLPWGRKYLYKVKAEGVKKWHKADTQSWTEAAIRADDLRKLERDFPRGRDIDAIIHEKVSSWAEQYWREWGSYNPEYEEVILWGGTVTIVEPVVESTLSRIDSMLLTENWSAVRKWFDVREPLFHATTGPRSVSIFRDGFLKSSFDGSWGRGNDRVQWGISTARTLQPLLDGEFGQYVLVLDGGAIKRNYEVKPVQYGGKSGWLRDEQEERIWTKKLPVKYIRGIIILHEPYKFEKKELAEKFDFPIVYKTKNGWESVNAF